MKPDEGLRHGPDYSSLFAWLQVATKGLSVESRARIREEITDHFQQAIDEGLRSGLSEDAAAEQTVASLGSPKAARRAFRSTYPTSLQGYLLRRFVAAPEPATSSPSLTSLASVTPLWDPNRERRTRPFLATMLVAFTAVMIVLDPRALQLQVSLLALMVVAALVLVTAVPSLFRHGRQRAALALGASAELFLWGAYLIAPAVTQTDTLGIRLWFVVVLAVVAAAYYLPLLRKLSKQRAST